MTQTKEDLDNIKSKLLGHIKSTYSKEKADEMTERIQKMDEVEFVGFLKTQGLIKSEEGETSSNCVFCSMIKGDIPTTKIGENNSAICILEINPISAGHSMIIPKFHITSSVDMPQEINELVDSIIIDITRTFKPQRIDKVPGNIMGHEIINLIPVYNNESIESPRNSETPEGLARIKEQIENSKTKQIEISDSPKEIIKEESTKEEINDENTWLPKRFP